MAFPREYTTTRCFSSRLNPSILKPVFVGHGVLSPLSILNMSVLRSKGTVTRSQQPGGSGITQSMPVLGSPGVGDSDRRPIRTTTAVHPERRIVSYSTSPVSAFIKHLEVRGDLASPS